MKSRFKTLFWVLGVPAGFLVLFLATYIYFEIEPDESILLASLTLSALGALGIGGVVLGGIFIIKNITKADRRRMVVLFPRGLVLTQLALAVQVLLIAFMMAAGLFILESILIGRVHIWIIGSLALGGLYGAMVTFSNATGMGRPVETWVNGYNVESKDAPALWQHINAMADQVGTRPPDNILAGFEPNFFVTESHIRSLGGQYRGRTLYVSLSLMRIMNQKEFSSVLCHELAHFKGEDTVFSQRFYPVYRGAFESAAALHEDGGSVRAVVLQPAIAVLEYFLETFGTLEGEVSRGRELEADREAARITGPDAMAASLAKVHVVNESWNEALKTLLEDSAGQNAIRNPGETFARHSAAQFTPARVTEAAASAATHPTDSHPPLSVRLEALGSSAHQVKLTPADFAPAPSALALAELPELEEKLIKAHQIQLDAYIKALRAQAQN